MSITNSRSGLFEKLRAARQYITETTKRKTIAAVTTGILIGGAIGATPYIHRAVQNYRARNAYETAQKAHDTLQRKLITARDEYRNNHFLMTDLEIQGMDHEIDDSQEKLYLIARMNAQVQRKLGMRQSEDVLCDLNPKCNSQDGNAKETPISISEKEQKDLDVTVIEFCKTKRTARDAVWTNEQFLKARLKKPLRETADDTADLRVIENPKFLTYIPKLTPEIAASLGGLAPELYNSLGANVEAHRPALVHLLDNAKRQQVKDNAQAFMNQTIDAYMKVKGENDKITIKYRPEEHDGKWFTVHYKEMLALQEKPLSLIHAGDNLLAKLDKYYQEAHEQWYKVVTEHTRSPTTFSHTRTKLSTCERTDQKGRRRTESCLKTEHYTTSGYKFYYTVRTVRPDHTSDERIYVGQKDEHDSLFSYSSWNYATEQQIGYLLEWKRLHDDRAGIIRGGDAKAKGAGIEPLLSSCKR